MRAQSRLRRICVEFAGGPDILGYLQLLTESLFRAPIVDGGDYHFRSRASGRFPPDFSANSYSRLDTAAPHFGRGANYPRRRRKMRNVGDNFSLSDRAIYRHLIEDAQYPFAESYIPLPARLFLFGEFGPALFSNIARKSQEL